MKQLCILVLFILTLCSCKEDKKKLKKKTHFTLSGKINNFKRNKIILSGFDFSKKIKFNKKKKTFSFKFNVDSIASGNYKLKIKEKDISFYLDGKSDLKIILDAKNKIIHPKFKGGQRLLKINKYLIRKRKGFSRIVGSSMKLFILDELKFTKKLKEYKNFTLKLLKKSKLNKSFSKKEARSIQHFYNRSFNNYENHHGLVLGEDDFEVSDSFLDNVKELDFNNEIDYKFSVDYRLSLEEYIEASSINRIEKLEDGEGNLDLVILDMINEKVSNEFIKNILVYNIAKTGIVVTEDLDKFYDKVNSYCTDVKNKTEIARVFKKFKAVSKGQPSPKFGKLKNFKGGKTSLNDIIGKGKYIYIDVWASWCGFCKVEIPLLNGFEEKYHRSNVEFVSINVNALSGIKSWDKDVRTRKMNGIQLFAGEEAKDFEFAKKYIIEGLPRFILLNPKGEIISPNAPRPTNGYELDMLFEKYGINVNE